MRLALALFLVLHGLAHLVGFLTPWGLAPKPTGEAAPPPPNVLFSGRVTVGRLVSRGLGFVWLIVALAFVTVAYGLWRDVGWSLGGLIAVTLISLGITLVWWPASRIGAAINTAVLVGLLVIGMVQFRHDMSVARARVLSRSATIQTASGLIEVATAGTGHPVLALHGTAGGWDQGYNAAFEITRHGYRIVAPSRFGYLRTPWRADASPMLEADTWAMLLDSLGIDRVAIMSWSAGAAPAIQFALRHPERVSKLVFFVPGAGGILPPAKGPPPWLVGAIFKWNFPIWAAQRVAPTTMLKWVAVPTSLVSRLEPRDREALDEAIRGIFPVSTRHDGMVYDARSQSGAFGVFPIRQIAAPTLWISADDDLYRTALVARFGASAVPGARLLVYESGGHLLLGRGPEMWPLVADFLRD